MSDETRRDWLRENVTLSTILTLCLMVGGWVVWFATEGARINEHDRRIGVLETEIVPRKEHEATQQMQLEKEKLLDERLTNIERMLAEMLQRH